LKVLVVSPSLAKRLSDILLDEIEVIHPEKGKDDELEVLAEDVEVIVSTRLLASVAKAANNLKLLQKTGAGADKSGG
jgi:phosphoglycerate dehydrogenase-like enzyme